MALIKLASAPIGKGNVSTVVFLQIQTDPRRLKRSPFVFAIPATLHLHNHLYTSEVSILVHTGYHDMALLKLASAPIDIEKGYRNVSTTSVTVTYRRTELIPVTITSLLENFHHRLLSFYRI